MTDFCEICDRMLQTPQEIEDGVCSEHIITGALEVVDSPEPLNFEEDSYYGVTDSGRIEDGC